MRIKVLGVLFFATLTITLAAQESQVATGTPAFGSYGGGPFDTINLGNLNAHFAIPIVSKAGRGQGFNFNLAYDSSIWMPVTSGSTTSWTNVTDTTWGWTTSLPRGGHVTYDLSSSNYQCENELFEFELTYTNFAY
jgi:hypothetical protein